MAKRTSKIAVAPLGASPQAEEICLEIADNSAARRSAVAFFGLVGSKAPRDPLLAAGRMADEFVRRNQPLLEQLDVQIDRDFTGGEVAMVIRAGNTVGAVPLYSPTSAKMDFGLVVQPRFPWSGIGPMLSEMGWRVGPVPLRLPLLRRSERRVPPWVLSSMILTRMDALLRTQDRRFSMTQVDLTAPRGSVDWTAYATTRVPYARLLEVPCTFPDLQHNRELLGSIRYTVEKQIRSLEEQRGHGAHVHRLLDFAGDIWKRVRSYPPQVPTRPVIERWLRQPMRGEAFHDGVEGIQWTAEDRGLAGVSDLQGVPWRMPMESFYEAWVETVLTEAARRTGGRLYTGRNRETVHSLAWTPSYMGSQRSLVPDFRMEFGEVTLIVDAKYKRHMEELQFHSWRNVEAELREQHRHDLLQVLAYSTLSPAARVVVCLAYPCTAASWQVLRGAGRLHHRAEISVGPRSVLIWLTAIPMEIGSGEVATEFSAQLQAMVRAA